jgi:hypothetical protein
VRSIARLLAKHLGYRAAAETFQIEAFYLAAQCKAPAFANKFFALRDYFGANAII